MREMIFWHEGKVSVRDRTNLLGQKGMVLWFTGLSGSGKSTITAETERQLIAKGLLAYRLDGDNIRHGLNAGLGFSEEDRFENIRRVAHVATLFKDAAVITLAAFITPKRAMRDIAREIVGEDGFREIYVKADVETCMRRDPKGLYQKALNGEIKDFTGLSAGYEEPENPDLILDTAKLTPEQCVRDVLKLISDFQEI